MVTTLRSTFRLPTLTIEDGSERYAKPESCNTRVWEYLPHVLNIITPKSWVCFDTYDRDNRTGELQFGLPYAYYNYRMAIGNLQRLPFSETVTQINGGQHYIMDKRQLNLLYTVIRVPVGYRFPSMPPVQWFMRTDQLATWLGAPVEPGTTGSMPPDILADWLQDKAGDDPAYVRPVEHLREILANRY